VLEAGVVYAPILDTLFAARRGGGATRDGVPIHVSTIDTVDRAMVCTGFNPDDYDRNGRHFGALSRAAQAVRRDGSAALDLAFVAAGVFDAFWEFDLKPWDVAAGYVLITEAGGRVTGIDGEPLDLDAGSILASNGIVHDEMRSLLANA
jgi:myo-inositol-1(or 4)-monophosphatase